MKGKAPAKKAAVDAHGLGTKSVRDDWRQMQAPPLEMFHFARKVVDEYTYLEARDIPTIKAIKASASWVLSGTPPMDTFDDVKGIAEYLGINLGAPDPQPISKRGKVGP